MGDIFTGLVPLPGLTATVLTGLSLGTPIQCQSLHGHMFAPATGAVLVLSGVLPSAPGLMKPRVLMVCAWASPAAF